MFLRHSPTCIGVKDAYGVRPGTYAMRNKHIECWKLLTIAYFTFQCAYGFSLATRCKLLQWSDRAKERVSLLKAEKKRTGYANGWCAPDSKVGGLIVVNGFHDREMGPEFRMTSPWSSCDAIEQGYSKTKDRAKSGMKHTGSSMHSEGSKSVSRTSNSLDASCRFSDSNHTHGLSSSTTPSKQSCRSGPANPKQKARLEAKGIIVQRTGKTPGKIATDCFTMSQTFENMKWNAQMKLALKCSLSYIEKNGT